MSAHISAIPESIAWKQAYLAAVLEKDRNRIPGLIDEARSKLSSRLLELKAASDLNEIEAIQDAGYLLQGLHSSLSYRDDLQN